MLKKLIFAAIILSGFTACKSKDAFNYSESFVKKEQSLSSAMEKTEADVKTFNASEKFDSISMVSSRMEKMVNDKLNEIKEQPAPDVKEGANFKTAGIKYFEYIKSIYTTYKEYGNAKTAEDRQIVLTKLQDIVALKAKAIADVKEAQNKFAAANNFKVEK